jgi:Conserved region in glutamate synthase
VRSHVRVLASGRVVTGFDIAHKLAIGADAVYCARAMMFALGCIQARRCNTNSCPTGVATQNPELVRGLVVSDKGNPRRELPPQHRQGFLRIIAAAGLEHPRDLRPWHIVRRVSPTELRTYAEIFDYLQPGDLLAGRVPDGYRRAWDAARHDSFTGVAPGGMSRALLG